MKTYKLIKNGSVIRTKQAETKPPIAPSKGEWLEVVEETIGVIDDLINFDSSTMVNEITSSVVDNKWKIVNTIRNKTAYELWEHKDFSMRIIAPIELILTDEGVKFKGWWDLKKLPYTVDEYYIYLYCNHIEEAHQDVLASLSEYLIIEERPNE